MQSRGLVVFIKRRSPQIQQVAHAAVGSAVVLIGLLAAMAIPAFQKVRQASQAKVCINNERMLVSALDQYRLEHGTGPKSWDEIIGPGKLIREMPKCLLGGTYSAKFENGEYEVRCSVKGHNADEYTGPQPAGTR